MGNSARLGALRWYDEVQEPSSPSFWLLPGKHHACARVWVASNFVLSRQRTMIAGGQVSMAKSTQEDVLKRLKSVYCESKPIKQADFATGNTGELLTGLGAHIAAPVMELQFLAYSLVDDTANLDFTPNATSTVDKPLNTTEAWRVVVGNDVFQQDWFKNNQVPRLPTPSRRTARRIKRRLVQ